MRKTYQEDSDEELSFKETCQRLYETAKKYPAPEMPSYLEPLFENYNDYYKAVAYTEHSEGKKRVPLIVF